jgi:hypothetical protein
MKKIKHIINKIKKAFTLSKELDIDNKSNWSIADWLMYFLFILIGAIFGIMQGGC